MITYLLTKANNGKFRFACVSCDEEYNDGYRIDKFYGQVGGKITYAPACIVNKTHQNRTWLEQLQLQFNHEVKKYLDKGYIIVDKDPNTYTIEELSKLYGDVKTDQAGVIKPQLAKQADKITNKAIFDKVWMASRKIDGVKALFYFKDGEIHTASRGGDNYDVATTHLRTNQDLIDFFTEHPTVILDGELYKHGYSLQSISGAVRNETLVADWLEYWIYDCYVTDMPNAIACERYKFLCDNLGLPVYPLNMDDSPIKVLQHVYVYGWDEIMQKHNQYVEEGFEGECLTNPDCPYKPGSRGNQLLKVKMYQDDEFKIIGISEGVREEDMCFTLLTKENKEFKAKPIGPRELKQQYRDNIKDIIGKMATVKFFYYSDDGIPLQPVVKCIRDYDI